MSAPLRPETIWNLVGAGVIVAVLAIASYFYFVSAAVDPVESSPRNYSLSAIQEMQAPSDTNVFIKTIPLRDVPESSGEAVQFSPSDLGKTDLTRNE